MAFVPWIVTHLRYSCFSPVDCLFAIVCVETTNNCWIIWFGQISDTRLRKGDLMHETLTMWSLGRIELCSLTSISLYPKAASLLLCPGSPLESGLLRERKNVFTKCKETKKTKKQHIYPRLYLNRRYHYKDKDDLIPQLTVDTHPTTK